MSALEPYMIIDLDKGVVDYADIVPSGGWSDEYFLRKMVLRLIEPCTFEMETNVDLMRSTRKIQGICDDSVKRQVSISKAYYIGIFEITQKQYEIITGSNLAPFKCDLKPVDFVSYDMIRGRDFDSNQVANDSFFGKLRSKTKLDFDLPTEEQWECACKTSPRRCKSLNNQNIINDKDHTVINSSSPNSWGVYDMHGLVWEWCLSGELRGGGWSGSDFYCRSARRQSCFYPDFAKNNCGFRVALVP